MSDLFSHRKGEYKKGDVPCLYLRGYPEWASSREDLQKKAASLDSAIVREVAAHTFQYVLYSKTTEEELLYQLRKKYDEAGRCFETDSDFLHLVLTADPDVVCKVLCDSMHLIRPAKLQEAIAIYKHGVRIENALIINHYASRGRVTSMKHEEEGVEISYSISDFHDYCSVPVVCPLSKKKGDGSKSKASFCKRKACLAEKKMLKKSTSVLKAKMIQIRKENEELKQKNHHLEAKVNSLEAQLSPNSTGIKRGIISYRDITATDDSFKLHADLSTVKHIDWLFSQIENSASKVGIVSVEDKC